MVDGSTIVAKAGAAAMGQTPQRMRVLHVIPTLGPGGSERFLLDLLNNLDRSRFETHVCVLGSLNAFPGRLPASIEVSFLDRTSSLASPKEIMAVVAGLRRLIAKFRPDLMHSHLWHAIRPTALATLGTALPHVAHLHEAWPRLAGTAPRDRLMRRVSNWLLAREPTRFIAVSEHTSAFTARHVSAAAGRTVIIENGVDTETFAADDLTSSPAAAKGPIVIAMAGWLERFKGQELLIRAAADLTQRGLDIEVRFAGIGRMREQYVALSRELGVDKRVRFDGMVEDMPAFLRAADIFVLPSSTEGMPLSVLEAMAVGLPVVASRVGGIPEMIDDERNGLLLGALTPDALADALARLAGSSEMRQRLGRAARATVAERFTFARTARRIEKLYTTLVQTRPAAELSTSIERSAN